MDGSDAFAAAAAASAAAASNSALSCASFARRSLICCLYSLRFDSCASRITSGFSELNISCPGFKSLLKTGYAEIATIVALPKNTQTCWWTFFTDFFFFVFVGQKKNYMDSKNQQQQPTTRRRTMIDELEETKDTRVTILG